MGRKCVNLRNDVVVAKFNKVKGLIIVDRPLESLSDEDIIESLLDHWLSSNRSGGTN